MQTAPMSRQSTVPPPSQFHQLQTPVRPQSPAVGGQSSSSSSQVASQNQLRRQQLQAKSAESRDRTERLFQFREFNAKCITRLCVSVFDLQKHAKRVSTTTTRSIAYCRRCATSKTRRSTSLRTTTMTSRLRHRPLIVSRTFRIKIHIQGEGLSQFENVCHSVRSFTTAAKRVRHSMSAGFVADCKYYLSKNDFAKVLELCKAVLSGDSKNYAALIFSGKAGVFVDESATR